MSNSFDIFQKLPSPYDDLADLTATSLARLDISTRKTDIELFSAYEKKIYDQCNKIFLAIYKTIPCDKKLFVDTVLSIRNLKKEQFK